MRYLIMVLICLLCAACVKSSVQQTGELWQAWQAMDELLQENYPEQPPIILVNGWNGNEFTWPSAAELQEVELEMHRDIYFFTYRTGIVANRFPPLELLEEQLERYLASFKQVDVIAHSMGGLIVRQYLSHHNKHPVRRLLFLSTPHFGTDAANILGAVASVDAEGNLQADEMRPGSDFLWQLNLQEGQELQGVDVLNAYVDAGGLLQNDFVVEEGSAWLPWAMNVSVRGDHHSLAKYWASYSFITDFLRAGIVSQKQSEIPAGRKLWLRVTDDAGNSITLTSTMLRRMDAQLRPHQHKVSVCCDRPSALYESARQSLVVEALTAEDVLWFTQRDGRKPLLIKRAGSMAAYPFPVSLQEFSLPNR
ncbi:MAG: alpha/beta fold hydrolase [Mariprofundaceae bacterium]